MALTSLRPRNTVRRVVDATRRRLALAATVVLGIVAPAALLPAAPALASSETVIGFDHFPGGAEVPAGTVAGAQWETEGLKLGKAEEFGQASVAG
ncbi:MAG: hypothetical protein ACYDA6_09625, partial [Solirubrobacteraceae bacterium]